MITIHHGKKTIELSPDSRFTLAQSIFLEGLWKDVPLCSGLGRCGLCKVRYVSDAPEPHTEEYRHFEETEIEAGYRLSCMHPAQGCEIELPPPTRSVRIKDAIGGTKGQPYQLAVDLGTTSIQWAAVQPGARVTSGSELNPQTGLGGEIMSRLAFAKSRKRKLIMQELILKKFRVRLAQLERKIGAVCTRIGVAGNPAMALLLLNKDTSGIATAPYRLDYRGGEEHVVSDDLPPIYIPPLLAPFIGGDLTTGLTVIEYLAGPEYPFLLADLGTNGEFVLALSPHERVCASVPMGPALEGVGLRFGRTAGPGTITRFEHTPLGLDRIMYDASGTATSGLSGTAYLSLAATLKRQGVLNAQGLFQQGTNPLAKRLSDKLEKRGDEPVLRLDETLYLPASDVEEMLKVKAAFNLALSALLRETGLKISDLKTIRLAGALGEHANLADLEVLGFLPPGSSSQVVREGNTSLRGMELILGDPAAQSWAETLTDSVRTIDLANAPEFGDMFLERMRFEHLS